MTMNKRFVSITDTDLEISIKDNLTKKYPFSLVCENLDEFEPLLNMVINVCDEMNKLWEQTQRFEDHNKRLMEENDQLKSYTGEMEDYLARLEETNDELKQENSVFEGKDAKHYQRWVKQIKKYVEETNTDFTYDDDFIIKIALSYTLQSLRNGESLKRFQWDYEELGE